MVEKIRFFESRFFNRHETAWNPPHNAAADVRLPVRPGISAYAPRRVKIFDTSTRCEKRVFEVKSSVRRPAVSRGENPSIKVRNGIRVKRTIIITPPTRDVGSRRRRRRAFRGSGAKNHCSVAGDNIIIYMLLIWRRHRKYSIYQENCNACTSSINVCSRCIVFIFIRTRFFLFSPV